MTDLQALILGIIQGLTEFLPVSSSGHLELAKAILGDQSVPEESLLFTVVVHFATALSTVVVFRQEVIQIFRGLFRFQRNEELYFSIYIVLSMIPAALVGLFFNKEIEQLFGGQILLVGLMLIITALLLLFANRARDQGKPLTPLKAVVVGLAQAIAIMPGISRSGATISASLLLGLSREKAARFSFLMVVPLILGKMAKDLQDGAYLSLGNESLPWPIIIGFAAAFFTGLIACKWMIVIVRRSNLDYFAYYCFAAGLLAIISTFIF